MPFSAQIARLQWIRVARTFVVGVGISLATGGFSKSVMACDCASPQNTIPTMADKSVPANTKIWTNAVGCDQAVVQKQGGTTVATTTTRFGFITVITPSADLEVGSTYEVTNCNGGTNVVSTFKVTEGPDTTPPEKPTFTLGETQSSGSSLSSCGEELYVPLQATHQGALLVLDIAGRSTLDPQTLTGKPVDVFFQGSELLIGYKVCSSNNWNFDEDGDAVNTRLGVFDLAGNFSGMTDPLTVEPSCTCTVVGTPEPRGGYAMASLAFVGIAMMRRQRATKSR